jgi:hypothetical protein
MLMRPMSWRALGLALIDRQVIGCLLNKTRVTRSFDDVASCGPGICQAFPGGGGNMMEPVIVTAAPLLDQEVRVMSLLHGVPAAYGRTRPGCSEPTRTRSVHLPP